MLDVNKYKDEQLIDIIGSGSDFANLAFDAIYEKYSCKLNAFCTFKTNTKVEAEELFEDTWLKFIEFIRSGRKITNILSYLYTTAKNISIDKFRKKNSNRQIKIEYTDDIEIFTNEIEHQLISDIENREMISIIKSLIDNLKDTNKTAFLMQWFGEMTYKEIAQELNISPENAKMRCHRAMQELLIILKPYYADEIK
jgi:RNA polymerase sigma factor (sigma-70 family)